MKDPSLHITESDLVKVLGEVFGINQYQKGQARRILKAARPYSIPGRSVVSSSDRIEKKVHRMIASSTGDADLMARMLVAVRRQLKHKGVQQVKPASRDWDIIKAMAEQATDFCNDFEITNKREGYIAYLKAGIAKMQQFSLRKYPNLYQAICTYHQAITIIDDDEDKGATQVIHKYYLTKVGTKTGFVNSYKDRPEKYMAFVEVRKYCKYLGIRPEIYIDAQFDSLAKFDALPDPLQLIGQKAKERLNKYMYENNISIRHNGTNKNKPNQSDR